MVDPTNKYWLLRRKWKLTQVQAAALVGKVAFWGGHRINLSLPGAMQILRRDTAKTLVRVVGQQVSLPTVRQVQGQVRVDQAAAVTIPAHTITQVALERVDRQERKSAAMLTLASARF